MQISEILAVISNGYFLRQVLVITGLFIIGYLFLQLAKSDMTDTWQCLWAFPAGLAAYGVLGMLLLTLGIEFELSTMLIFAAVIVIEIYLMLKKEKFDFQKIHWKYLIAAAACVILLAVICTSGLLSVSVDNDSFYYYSAYPEALVREKAYRLQFDVFLTDVGPMAVVVNTLPYMFGFANTFGIQHFLNLNFILIFMAASYEELAKKLPFKSAASIAAFSTVFLATSAAFLTTAKWIMAGDYFMIYFFFAMYLGYREGISNERHEDYKILLIMFTVMLSMLRMEGIVMTLFLILCLSMLKYSDEELLQTFVMPAGMVSFLYYFFIFIRLGVKPLYAFMRPLKAVFIMAVLLLFTAYVVFIRGKRFKKLLGKMELVITALMLIANAGMLAVGHERYLTNLYMFFMNVRRRNGWGYFGYIFFAALIITLIMAVVKKQFKLGFFDVVMLGYILASVGTAWARGNNLRIGVGDSGNRVMLTAVPVIVYAMTMRLTADFCKSPSDQSQS